MVRNAVFALPWAYTFKILIKHYQLGTRFMLISIYLFVWQVALSIYSNVKRSTKYCQKHKGAYPLSSFIWRMKSSKTCIRWREEGITSVACEHWCLSMKKMPRANKIDIANHQLPKRLDQWYVRYRGQVVNFHLLYLCLVQVIGNELNINLMGRDKEIFWEGDFGFCVLSFFFSI